MRTVNQGKLIGKIIRFVEIDSKKSLSDSQKAEYRAGLCHGFSITYSYMAAVDGLAWWNKVLDQIAAWDETEASLDLNSELKNHLLRASHYVIFNQADFELIDLLGLTYKNLLLPEGLFVSEKGPIRCQARAAGNFSATSLDKLLNETIFSGEAIFLIGSINHTCSLRYKDGCWYFYDPNKAEGEIHFNNKNELIHKIPGTDHTQPLRIEIASWNPAIKLKTDALMQNFNALCLDNAIELVQKHGLYMLARYAPKQFDVILERAKTDIALLKEIGRSLFEMIKNTSVMYYFHLFEPEQFKKILALYDPKTQEFLSSLESIPAIITLDLEKMYKVINCIHGNISSSFLTPFVKKISSTQYLTSKEKIDFFKKILEKIDTPHSHLDHALIIKKLKMVIVIEQYIASRVVEVSGSPKIMSNLVREGIFKWLPKRNRCITEVKVSEAERLKAVILYSTDDPKKLSNMIAMSKMRNENMARDFFSVRKGAYQDCLLECEKILGVSASAKKELRF